MEIVETKIIFNTETKSININKNESVGVILNQICKEMGLESCDEYAVIYDRNQKLIYLTEQNKNQLPDTLYLDLNPLKMIDKLKEQLSSHPDNIDPLIKLANLTENSNFIECLIEHNHIQWLVTLFISTSNETVKIHLMNIFNALYGSKHYVSDHITDQFLENLLEYCNSKSPSNTMLLGCIFNFLVNCISHFPELCDFIIDAIQLNKLIQLLACDDDYLRITIIRLINTVFHITVPPFQSNLANVIIEKNELRVFTSKYVIKENLSKNMMDELYLVQKMILYDEINSYNSKVALDNNKLEELKRILALYDNNENPSEVIRKFGLKSASFMEEELLSLPCNLVIDCLTYYVSKNQGAAYYPPYGPPLFVLIRVACMSIAKEMKNFNSKSNNDFLPILFEKPKTFQEMVCKVVKHHKYALKEYADSNHTQIVRYLEEKIRRVLTNLPSDLELFFMELEKLDKKQLESKMTQDNAQWNEKLKNLPPVSRLRNIYAPQVEELIKKQSFNRMVQGIPAEIIAAVQKSKKPAKEEFIKLKLNSAYNAFEYQQEGSSMVTMSITEISKIYTSDQAALKLDEKLIKKIPISTLVVVEMKNAEKHAFSIEPEYHTLIMDVIAFAENKRIDEKWEPQSYSSLLDCIIDVLLMDLNEKDIPLQPPRVPDPPPNFNFASGD